MNWASLHISSPYTQTSEHYTAPQIVAKWVLVEPQVDLRTSVNPTLVPAQLSPSIPWGCSKLSPLFYSHCPPASLASDNPGETDASKHGYLTSHSCIYNPTSLIHHHNTHPLVVCFSFFLRFMVPFLLAKINPASQEPSPKDDYDFS